MNKFYCQCENCDVFSRYKANIKKHMVYKHDMLYVEQTKCEICNIDFSNNKQYEIHRKAHHPTDEEVFHIKELRRARNRRYYLNKKLGL
jgi:Flp pilus assembly CpaF family ATPase